jgi:hypothetical protein
MFVKLILLLSFLIQYSANAETLSQKLKNARDLSALELTALTISEIRVCENFPEYSGKMKKLITILKGNPNIKEANSIKALSDLESEANAVVAERGRNASKEECSRTLSRFPS